MFCYKCGEENPDGAQYCRNCGSKLKEDIKKTEIIEATPHNSHTETRTTTTTSTRSGDGNSTFMGCCLCLIGIFIIGAILSLFGL